METRRAIGATVQVIGLVNTGQLATVIRHGRDMNGPYTEVRLADGSIARFHRACLLDLKETP